MKCAHSFLRGRLWVVLSFVPILLTAQPALAAHFVQYEYYAYASGTDGIPLMGSGYLTGTTYCAGDYTKTGGNQNEGHAAYMADLATGQVTAFTYAVGHREDPYSYWNGTGRVEHIVFKDDITFTVPAGTYPDGVEVRMHGWLTGSISSVVGGSAQIACYANLGGDLFQTGLQTIGVMETGTLPMTHFFVCRQQLVAPGQTLAFETQYTREAKAHIHRAWTSTAEVNPGDGWVTGHGTDDFSEGFQITALWTPPGVTWTSDSGVFLNQVPSNVSDGPPLAPATLGQNTPNPFNPRTVIPFSLKAATVVDLEIFDLAGHRVRVLRAGQVYAAGDYRVVWQGRDDQGRGVAAGEYFVRLTAGGTQLVRPMMLLK